MGVDEHDEYIVTNKEAAEILAMVARNLYINRARANGKTVLNYRINMAFIKAIALLESTPDDK